MILKAVDPMLKVSFQHALSVTGVLVLFIGHFLPSFTFCFFMNNYIITHVFLFVKKPAKDSFNA